MADSSSGPEGNRNPPSFSKNLYWLLALLLPVGWWVALGTNDRVRRTIIALVALTIFLAGVLVGLFSKKSSMGEERSRERPPKLFPNNYFWFVLSLLSVFWWLTAGHNDKPKSILLAAVSLAAFMFGVMAGFVFTSFGDELATFGKIRDWVIAGITGATVVELAEQGGVFKSLLKKFVLTESPGEFGLVISMAIVYFAVGFLFMFLQREMLLNLFLAKSRAERGKLDGSVQAGLTVQRLLQKLPPSLVTGVDDIDAVLDPDEAKDTRKLLDDDDVKLFLSQAEQALKEGHTLDYDTVSKVAYIYYYKVYGAPDEQKSALSQYAIQWIQRALVLNPLHIDLLMKYADLEMIEGEYASAVAILEQSLPRDDAPFYVRQWLGYALLQMPDRLQDSIKYSQDFLHNFPEASDSMFNIALAYAKLYCRELKSAGKVAELDSDNRKRALEYMEEALKRDPDYRKHVQENYSSKGGSFECMESDPDYRRIVWLDSDPKPTSGAQKNNSMEPASK